MNVYDAIDLRRTAKKNYVGDSLDSLRQLHLVHEIISGLAQLGGRLVALPMSVCPISDYTIQSLIDEGFKVNIEHRDVLRGKFYDTVYISWYEWNVTPKTDSNVIYRPQRGGLEESVRDAIVFENAVKMKEYLVNHYKGIFGRKMFTADDIILYGDKEGYEDERIGWEDVRHVCIKRMGNEVFEKPACIGMWATKWK